MSLHWTDGSLARILYTLCSACLSHCVIIELQQIRSEYLHALDSLNVKHELRSKE